VKSLVLCALIACGDNLSPDAGDCKLAPLDAPWLRGLLTDVVTDLARAPRATATERDAARTDLSNRLTALGWQPMLDSYPTGANVYATIPSTRDMTSSIIVGAHFDTVSGSPGADDNATGVAVVLAVARYLQDVSCRGPIVTVVLFDQEELGLFGSRAFAATVSNVIAVHTIDQVGWDSDGDRRFELELPTPDLEQEYRATAALIGVPVTVTTTSGTDHQSFRDRGMPAIGLAEAYVEGDTSPFRHTPNDTADTVNFDYLVDAAQLVMGTVSTSATYAR
jgi:Zn-dependent M28 family amino/carboxypeptidase